ncbi:NADH dehydrogenase [ubiquinone] iron-sulfur protein 6, mitochondrial isoform X1 [Pongo pygmaeus]|uniref:NADH dehydrogenase [ubiquinone] iron-sulfur protein 6, mitochondrial isoform X1 n=1 Tax=Pongo pygmaeus TaxID=9600 RepID=UPI00300D6AC1
MAAAMTFYRLLNRWGEAARSLRLGARCFGVRVSPTGEKVTHTGQVYDDKDYRRIRFVGRQKEVNENFAIDLIAEQPVSEVETRVIACDGGGGALGHPKVYINLVRSQPPMHMLGWPARPHTPLHSQCLFFLPSSLPAPKAALTGFTLLAHSPYSATLQDLHIATCPKTPFQL